MSNSQWTIVPRMKPTTTRIFRPINQLLQSLTISTLLCTTTTSKRQELLPPTSISRYHPPTRASSLAISRYSWTNSGWKRPSWQSLIAFTPKASLPRTICIRNRVNIRSLLVRWLWKSSERWHSQETWLRMTMINGCRIHVASHSFRNVPTKYFKAMTLHH